MRGRAVNKPTHDWLFIGVILGIIVSLAVITPSVFIWKQGIVESEESIIFNTSCYDLKLMIAEKKFTYSLATAEHNYEWRCDK